jgi:hypothetical protein
VVLGKCIGDRNFKAYVLSFFWGAVWNAIMFMTAIGGVIGTEKALGLGVGACGLVLFFICVAFGVEAAAKNMADARRWQPGGVGRQLRFREWVRSFGERWWMRVLPLPTGTTFLAWPGVMWDDIQV